MYCPSDFEKLKIQSNFYNSLEEKMPTKKDFKYASFYAYKCRNESIEGAGNCKPLEEIDEYVKNVRVGSKTVFQTIDLTNYNNSEKPA